MFGRQWFGPGSQAALDDDSLKFEALLRSRRYSKANQLLSQILVEQTQGRHRRYWLRQLNRLRRLQILPRNNNSISVAFTGFWPGFNPADNEVLNLFRYAASLIGRQIHFTSANADILLFSCFGEYYYDEHPDATRILYLGENVRPDYSEADYSISFDMSSYSGRNLYLPLWILRSAQYAPSFPDYVPYSAEDLEYEKPVNGGTRTVAYIGNNSTAIRLEAIQALKAHGWHVECYGSHTRPVANKIDALKKHRFNLCFENSYFPGYATEKLVDSFLGGAIPIYWGGAPLSTFNSLSFFNCDPYLSISSNIERFINSDYVNLTTLPPLLHQNAFNQVNGSAVAKLSKILLDLF